MNKNVNVYLNGNWINLERGRRIIWWSIHLRINNCGRNSGDFIIQWTEALANTFDAFETVTKISCAHRYIRFIERPDILSINYVHIFVSTYHVRSWYVYPWILGAKYASQRKVSDVWGSLNYASEWLFILFFEAPGGDFGTCTAKTKP